MSTGDFHDEIEEIYLVTRGTLTMRFADDVRQVRAGNKDATKLDDFWEASPEAKQSAG
jgi:hypothetical protein